jgi:hypothetical protein
MKEHSRSLSTRRYTMIVFSKERVVIVVESIV